MGNQACCAADDKGKPVENVAVEEPKVKEIPIFSTPAPSAAEAKEAAGGLAITFVDGDTSKELTFTAHPLGFTFKNASPLIVTRLTAGGNAEKLGVKVGTTVTKIGSTDVTDMKYDDILQLLKDSAAKLPSA